MGRGGGARRDRLRHCARGARAQVPVRYYGAKVPRSGDRAESGRPPADAVSGVRGAEGAQHEGPVSPALRSADISRLPRGQVVLRPVVAVLLAAAVWSTCSAAGIDYRRSIEGIARDISGLKERYPQLKEFSVAEHLRADRYQISYGYRTHKAQGRGGWTSGVPNPDEDGIWFYIDFHDPASTAQIHTQPATTVPYCVGDMRLSFLSLEGAKTQSTQGAIWQILKKHGAAECR